VLSLYKSERKKEKKKGCHWTCWKRQKKACDMTYKDVTDVIQGCMSWCCNCNCSVEQQWKKPCWGVKENTINDCLYLTRIDVTKMGTPTAMAETHLNDGGSKENKLRSDRGNHVCEVEKLRMSEENRELSHYLLWRVGYRRGSERLFCARIGVNRVQKRKLGLLRQPRKTKQSKVLLWS